MLAGEVFKTIIIVAGSLAALGILLYAVSKLRRRRPPKKFEGATGEWTVPEYTYNLKSSPMTAGENKFYFLLLDVLPDQYAVVPQLPLTAVVERPSQGSALAKIDRKSVDFGVFRVMKRGGDKVLRPAFLIELDDETHSLSYREERDKFVNGLCRQIGLPLLRVPVTDDALSEKELEKLVKPFI